MSAIVRPHHGSEQHVKSNAASDAGFTYNCANFLWPGAPPQLSAPTLLYPAFHKSSATVRTPQAMLDASLQGYLAHKKHAPPPRTTIGP